MRRFHSILWFSGKLAASLLLLSGLTGCGNSLTAPSQSHQTTGNYIPPAAPVASAILPAGNVPAPAISNDPLAGSGGLAGGDALASGTGGISTSSGFAPHDAMDSAAHMPTNHSHWLVGSIFDAQVAVALNSFPLGTYESPQDQDITMHLHKGINTVTFTYTPTSPDGSADLEVLESEHDPPIPPLVSFRSPASSFDDTLSQPITKTYTFIAH